MKKRLGATALCCCLGEYKITYTPFFDEGGYQESVYLQKEEMTFELNLPRNKIIGLCVFLPEETLVRFSDIWKDYSIKDENAC